MASSKREKELARQRAARQAARRAERERRRRQRTAIVASIVAVLLVAGAAATAGLAGRDDAPNDELASPTASPTESTSEPSAEPSVTPTEEAAAGECSYPPGDEPARPVDPPSDDVERSQAYTVTLQTSAGDVPFELLTADAPCTVHSFRHLAEADFFDDTPCHRLTDQGIFVLQCGDPSGTGRGGPGYSFPDENLEEATYPRGTVAMANSGPDTNGSQFFLVYKDSQLPPQYSPFGVISEAGLAVLDAIAAAGAAPPNESGNTAPNTPVQISDVVVVPVAG